MVSFKVGLLALLSLVCVQLTAAQTTTTSSSPPAGTACPDATRIRKPWEAYTAAEKTRYIAAIKLAMTKGFHQKFVELHTETASELEAHNNCMFIYWHRMYLLGYENMLRSLGTEYQCVTLPYWDHLSATARAAAGTCTNMEDCSPILKELGGSRTGLDKNLIIYSTTIQDTTSTKCVNQAPLNSFCGNNTVCAGCVLRGPAYKTAYPTEAAFPSVYQQMFTYSDWTRFGQAIERGVHNMVHSRLGGIMAYFQSPIDPIFYTHHSLIDLLQTVYLKCQLGSETATLTADQKGSDPRVWSNCARRNGGTFTSADTITMMTRDYSKKFVHVRTNPNNILYPFFKDLPAKFSDYVDAKDLGVYSYTYQLQGALTNMYTNCKASNTIKAAALMADERMNSAERQSYGYPLPVINGPTKTDTKFRLWTIAAYETAKLTGYTTEAARDQMELMMCYHSQECLGGVSDYDDTFRENFGVTGHPRCFTLLSELKSGKKIIGVPEWHDISSKFLSCPVPSLDADGTYHHHHADDYKNKLGKVIHGNGGGKYGNGDDDDDDDDGKSGKYGKKDSDNKRGKYGKQDDDDDDDKGRKYGKNDDNKGSKYGKRDDDNKRGKYGKQDDGDDDDKGGKYGKKDTDKGGKYGKKDDDDKKASYKSDDVTTKKEASPYGVAATS